MNFRTILFLILLIQVSFASGMNMIRVGDTNIKIPTPPKMINVTATSPKLLSAVSQDVSEGKLTAHLVFTPEDKTFYMYATVLTNKQFDDEKISMKMFKKTKAELQRRSDESEDMIKKVFTIYTIKSPSDNLLQVTTLPTKSIDLGRPLVMIRNTLLIKNKMVYIYFVKECYNNKQIDTLTKEVNKYLKSVFKANN
jgi:hypothetical protein